MCLLVALSKAVALPGRRRQNLGANNSALSAGPFLSFTCAAARKEAKREAFMMGRRVILELERADIKGTCTTHTYIGPDQLHSQLPTEP
jgi:hypothetical protein